MRPLLGIRDQLARRDPIGLTLASAAKHPQTLWLARYEAADGDVEHGVAAVARAMEHLNLFWANVGWLLRLPVSLARPAHLGRPHSRPPPRSATTCPPPPPPPPPPLTPPARGDDHRAVVAVVVGGVRG